MKRHNFDYKYEEMQFVKYCSEIICLKRKHKVLWQVDFFFIFRILDVLSNTKKTFRIAATVLSHLILGYHLFSDAYQNLIYSDE